MTFKGDKNFQILILGAAVFVLVLVAGIFLTLINNSYPAFVEFGLNFITGDNWDPVAQEFSAGAFIIGTILTSFIALFISFPVALAIAVFLGEYQKDGWVHTIISGAVELLAGIPSIIYGFWGLFVLVPIVRDFELMIDVPPYGVGIAVSALVLAIMIIPYSASIAREVISMTATELKDATYALGSTRYEVIKNVIIPSSSSGIISGVLLSLGRALGETMAVTMVIGNSNIFPDSIFAPGNTMASLIANEFTEATEDIYMSALIGIGLLLLLLSAAVNIGGKYIIRRFVPDV